MKLSLILLATIVSAAGCANQPPATPGKHLVYRDSTGSLVRQFDYPSDDLCRRVEVVAGGAARCQPDSMATRMQAQATLRYNPPGMLVQGHYQDLARCQSDTKALSAAVELINPCRSK